MSTSFSDFAFALSADDLGVLKCSLTLVLGADVKPAHRLELFARLVGYKTWASLLAALQSHGTNAVPLVPTPLASDRFLDSLPLATKRFLASMGSSDLVGLVHAGCIRSHHPVLGLIGFEDGFTLADLKDFRASLGGIDALAFSALANRQRGVFAAFAAHRSADTVHVGEGFRAALRTIPIPANVQERLSLINALAMCFVPIPSGRDRFWLSKARDTVSTLLFLSFVFRDTGKHLKDGWPYGGFRTVDDLVGDMYAVFDLFKKDLCFEKVFAGFQEASDDIHKRFVELFLDEEQAQGYNPLWRQAHKGFLSLLETPPKTRESILMTVEDQIQPCR